MKIVTTYFQRHPITKLELGIYGIIMLLGVGVSLWITSSGETISIPPKKETQYTTVKPNVSKAFSRQRFIGKVRANNFAMIHPRREGIIKDILVDVGDTVKAGQTIAYLFPPGVEGEGQSQIIKAKAELQSAQEELKNAESVAKQSVEVAKKKFAQTQTNLETLVSNSELTRSQIQQNQDQAETIAFQTLRNIEWVLFGESNTVRTAGSLVGNFNNRIQENKVFHLFKEVQNIKQAYETLNEEKKRQQLYTFLGHIEQLLHESEVLYRTANEDRTHPIAQVEKHAKDIQTLQTNILKAQEMIDDTLLSIDQLEATLDTAGKDFDLTKKQASKSVDQALNKLGVAQVAYQNALIKNGHVQITSPFTGRISARFVDVGQLVTPSKTIFEMIEVDTSLGGGEPLEIVFGVPEASLDSVEVGGKVTIETSIYGVSKTITATINRKSTALDQTSNTAMVHAVLSEEVTLPHNSNVYVYLQDMKNLVYEIPSSSIKKRRNQNFVFIQNFEGESSQPHYQIMEVQILAEDGEYSDIVSAELDLESGVVEYPSVSLFSLSK